MRFKGTIVDWNDERGFGFIQPAEGSARVFFHISACRDCAGRPSNGGRVTYDLGRDDRGRPRAKDVRESLAPAAATGGPTNAPHLGLAVTLSTAFLAIVTVLALVGYLTAIVAIFYWSSSLIVFCLYWLDKKAAERNIRRIPESTLQLLALVGGWPGAWVAQQQFRHKTRKSSFQIVFWFCAGLNCAALMVLLWRGGDPVGLGLTAVLPMHQNLG